MCVNFAKEIKWIKTIHYNCNICGIFGNGYEKTFASLANVRYRYNNVMFYTDFDFDSVWFLVYSTSRANVLGYWIHWDLVTDINIQTFHYEILRKNTMVINIKKKTLRNYWRLYI